jgi:DMSO/TMAO reductase YedYZ molybdopterin-dependent catalytic subunit
MFWINRPYRHAQANPGRLALGGIIERPNFGLSFDDLAALEERHQVKNVGAYAACARTAAGGAIRGVRIKALMELVGMHEEAAFLNIENHEGFAASVWRREAEALAIVCYARGDEPLSAADGGPFRLVVPGLSAAARDVWNLSTIEFSANALADTKGFLSPAKPREPGEVTGVGAGVVANSDPRTLVVPPPVSR